MYEPTDSEINDKAKELMEDWLYENNCDGLADAVVMNLPLLKKLLEADLKDLADARTDLLNAIEKYADAHNNFMEEAEDFLISQVGYLKRTDVDDYKFIPHDTRY